ncbi:MAG: FG-GAP-like repeat-containing protein, partial [Flavobacteriaceae bacterium]
NDGRKDLYVTNGLLRDIRNTDADKAVAQYINKARAEYIKAHPDGGGLKSIWEIVDLRKALSLVPSQPLTNYAYKNMGDLRFKKTMKDWGLHQKSFSTGAAYADLDRDGDLDLVVNNINEKPFIYRNKAEQLSNAQYLQLRLGSRHHNPTFGARATVYTEGEVQIVESTNVRGIYSTSDPMIHFGLGKVKKVDSVMVQWPNGSVHMLRDVATNQTLELFMEDGEPGEHKEKEGGALYFREVGQKELQFSHVENEFDDYAKQVLLPHKMSQFGPALAVGDVNADGLEDVFVGGAFNEPAKLLVQVGEGRFKETLQDFWEKEKGYEDVDATFVDINNDGYLDLYVVSGGNAYPFNDFHYTDRLYLNDLNGGFTKAAIMGIGRMSGSKVVPADMDNDGDMDLFVGGRHVPWQYPLPASSMLLVNDNGQLVNRTKEMAAELKDVGMVTDASWSDYDLDGDPDLFLVGEWMPLTLFENEEGILQRKENVQGLEESTGWWFSMEKADFDNDGDEDFVVGNLGLNYKYKTSPERPFDVYYNDFDNNGSYDVVLGYYNGDDHYPLRGFSCSAEQVPGLKEKFKKYNVFAVLEIDEVYGGENLDHSLHYKADTFASSYVENLGNGEFKRTDLPRLVQRSNTNDIWIDDINGDGHLDMVGVGNLFVSEIETPRNDAGTGWVLFGDGQGAFSKPAAMESGFFAPHDAKKLAEIMIQGQRHILVGNNNAVLQVFSISQ